MGHLCSDNLCHFVAAFVKEEEPHLPDANILDHITRVEFVQYYYPVNSTMFLNLFHLDR